VISDLAWFWISLAVSIGGPFVVAAPFYLVLRRDLR